ncbi:MAG TPA: efflux RND transporter periplasmic adaptor subunit [Planctomycetota bacterium]|nr:efflux RND transporter periplasmic adaptor subunit [Planctomycetota bacterium]HRR81051.1 efflux RND transporter periplasmic adaptor subunit [Planctomycetota bacterium]HRT96605.1 efflux RND transporter periplasmic adaptor subunit [Planctomycetota bacterium]
MSTNSRANSILSSDDEAVGLAGLLSPAREAGAPAHAARSPISLPRRRWWPWLLVPAVVAAGALGAPRLWRSRTAAPTATRATYTVQRADLPIVIRDTGSIDSLQSEIIKSRVEGMNTIINLVPEGTIITEEDVKQGKILVELDSKDIREKLSQQEVTFATAEATYKQAKESYDIEKSAGESKIKQGELDVRFGKMDLQAYVGQKLAEDALEGRGDLAALAARLCTDAINDRRAVEAEVARSLVEVEKALKEPASESGDAGPRGKQDAQGKSARKEAAEGGRSAIAGAAAQAESLDELLGGTALQKTRKFEADIGLAFEEFKRAADKVASYARLRHLGIKSSQQLEAEQLALMRARIALDQALTARELYLRYDLPKEAEKLLSGYRETQRELERIKARARSALAGYEAEVKSSESKYLLQKDRLEKLRTQLENCTMRATKPGLVVYATSGSGRHWSGTPIETGATVREQQEIIKMPDLTSLAVNIRVHETVVDKVKRDQNARITVDAFPNRRFTGKVLKVAILPNTSSSWINPDLKEYDTQVSIEGDLTGLKPGMSANVEIDVKTLKNVLQVPVQAVGARRGRTIVYVLRSDGSEEPRDVVTGESNDQTVEIAAGLAAGELVLLEAPQTAPSKEEEEATKKEDELNGDAPPVPPPGRDPGPRDSGDRRPEGPGGKPPRTDRKRPRASSESHDSAKPGGTG